MSLPYFRYLCQWAVRGDCSQGVLYRSQTALRCCQRRADWSEGHPPQPGDWCYYRKSGWLLGSRLANSTQHWQRRSWIVSQLLDKYFSHNQHQISDIELCLNNKVRVDLLAESNICSSASKRGKYRQELSVGGQTTRAVPFIIIPMKHGEFPIEVQAAVKDSWLSDGVMKMLRVVVREENILTLTQ